MVPGATRVSSRRRGSVGGVPELDALRHGNANLIRGKRRDRAQTFARARAAAALASVRGARPPESVARALWDGRARGDARASRCGVRGNSRAEHAPIVVATEIVSRLQLGESTRGIFRAKCAFGRSNSPGVSRIPNELKEADDAPAFFLHQRSARPMVGKHAENCSRVSTKRRGRAHRRQGPLSRSQSDARRATRAATFDLTRRGRSIARRASRRLASRRRRSRRSPDGGKGKGKAPLFEIATHLTPTGKSGGSQARAPWGSCRRSTSAGGRRSARRAFGGS